MGPLHTEQQRHSLPTRSGYIIDARIAWWKIQTCRQATVLTVTGELDASNADRFDASVSQLVLAGEPFVIDISELDFLGVQCIRILLDVCETCRTTGTRWALVVDGALRHMLSVVDRQCSLPVTSSLTEALDDVATARRSVVRLAPRSRASAVLERR